MNPVSLLHSFHIYFIEALDHIALLTPWRFVRLFWFFFLLDLPRYIIPDFIVFFINLFKREPEPFYGLNKKEIPLVSVIVPARNEEETIGLTLDSLLESTYPREHLEIIVIDDGSEDNTYAIANRYTNRGNVRVFRKENRGGKASCLMYGFNVSMGEFIVSVDSDSTFDRDAIPNLLRPFNDPSVGTVCGNVKVRNRRENLLTTMQYCEYLIGISIGRRFLSKVNMLTIISGAFGCYRRSALLETGAWDPGIGDDSNVTLKTRKLGYKIGFAPDAIVMTTVPATFSRLFKQRRRWDRSFIRNRFRKHGNILNPFVFSPTNLTAISINAFFRIVLLFTFVFFFIRTLVRNEEMFPLIFIFGWLIYTVSAVVSLSLSIMLSERRAEEWILLIYAPLFPFYRLFLRIPRLMAVFLELFRIQYTDPFYPKHVWKQSPRW